VKLPDLCFGKFLVNIDELCGHRMIPPKFVLFGLRGRLCRGLGDVVADPDSARSRLGRSVALSLSISADPFRRCSSR